MAMLNSDLVDRGEDSDDNDYYDRHHGDDGSDGVSGGLLAARSDNDRGAQVPGGHEQLLVASVEDPHQAPASQIPDGPLLVCSNVSPLGHIGYKVFLKHPK